MTSNSSGRRYVADSRKRRCLSSSPEVTSPVRAQPSNARRSQNEAMSAEAPSESLVVAPKPAVWNFDFFRSLGKSAKKPYLSGGHKLSAIDASACDAPGDSFLDLVSNSSDTVRVVYATADFEGCKNLLIREHSSQRPATPRGPNDVRRHPSLSKKPVPFNESVWLLPPREGHNWCLLRLASSARVYGIVLDTSNCEGLLPAGVSVEGANLGDSELNELDRVINSKSNSVEAMLEQTLESHSAKNPSHWIDIVQQSELHGPDSGNPLNIFKVKCPQKLNMLRVNIFPDGALARIRIYTDAYLGEPKSASSRSVSLVPLLWSDALFGRPHDAVADSGSSWWTRRNPSRPLVHRTNLKVYEAHQESEWSIFKLEKRGLPEKVQFTTTARRVVIQSIDLPELLRKDAITQMMWLKKHDRALRWEVVVDFPNNMDESSGLLRTRWDRLLRTTHVKVHLVPDGRLCDLEIQSVDEGAV